MPSTQSMMTYQPPNHVRLLKAAVSVIKKVLPGPLFDIAYKRGFAAYRGILSTIYSRHLGLAWITQDEARKVRTRAILDVMPYSLVGSGGLEATYDAALSLERNQVPGAFIECGVARGGSAALMAGVATRCGNNRSLWFFDSYEGLPEPTEEDYEDGLTGGHMQEMPAGSCLGTEEEVAWLLFEQFQLDRTKIRMVKGWFENTLKEHSAAIPEIALLRIDADWYESVKCCLETFYDQVSLGGAIIIDDYGTCYGAEKAVNEFLEDRGINTELVHDGRGGVTFRRQDTTSAQ